MNSINNNIEETRVGFDNAKLLKEAGFDVPCRYYYPLLEESHSLYAVVQEHQSPYTNGILIEKQHFQSALAPTQQLAIDWIRVNFGIHICIDLVDNTIEFYYDFSIVCMKDREYHGEDMIDQAKRINKWKEWQFNTPEEAKEAAILYVLTNLIK